VVLWVENEVDHVVWLGRNIFGVVNNFATRSNLNIVGFRQYEGKRSQGQSESRSNGVVVKGRVVVGDGEVSMRRVP